MISNEKIEALVEHAQAEGVQGDIRSVLQNALTVGDLIKYLQQYDASTPVELEIPVEIEGTDTMISEVAYAVMIFKNDEGPENTEVVTLQGCKPDLYEAYKSWTESDTLN